MQCDNTPENQEITGKTVEVVKPITPASPYWLIARYGDKTYSVRGSDCRKVKA